jgi:26S proteasome regulatory subunit N1
MTAHKTNDEGVTWEREVERQELSSEDQALLEGLELAVKNIQDVDPATVSTALEYLVKEVQSATSSMTSVPKPLKFLQPHYETLKHCHELGGKSLPTLRLLADLLAVLAMTMSRPGSREVLLFKIQGSIHELGGWGHEFVRALAGEVGAEYSDQQLSERKGKFSIDNNELVALVDEIVPFHLKHNAYAEAVDLLIETQRISKLLDDYPLQPGRALVDEGNFQRVCLYLLRCGTYIADPDDLKHLRKCAFNLYERHHEFSAALGVALQIGDDDEMMSFLDRCNKLFEESDNITRKQMAFLLARHRSNFEYAEDDVIDAIIGNNRLKDYYVDLGRDLDVLEPKTPEDIYKSHLGDTAFSHMSSSSTPQVDSARANLASTFVNAFVNAGFGRDLLMTPDGNGWLYKNKDHGMLAAAASLGMIMMWNVEEGLTVIDKFLYSSEENVRAGACLAIGIVSSSVRHESDPPIALLPEHVESTSPIMRSAAIVALGIAYAGSARPDVLDTLAPIVSDSETIVEVSFAVLSIGQTFVGTCNSEVASLVIQKFMEASDLSLEAPDTKFLGLGLGLLFFGRREKGDAMLEALKTIEHPMGLYASITLETCAYATTGDVLKIQKMLHICAEHNVEPSDKMPSSTLSPPLPKNVDLICGHQSVAVIGIALMAAGEEIGAEMTLRTFDHLLHYGEPSVRRAVPLALALLRVSCPDYGIADQMSRLTHDADAQVSLNAILGLGLIGAGTNNSRIAGLLRQLAEHAREPSTLFIVRLAQGLLHMGKGLLTISPFHADRSLVSKPAMGSILTFLHCCLDMNRTILDRFHYLMYHLASAMMPRFLLTVDIDLNMQPTSVRVGQAVETVGQAGRPKTITGFQTHTTPVLLGVNDRAELACDNILVKSHTLEGIVIVDNQAEVK